MILSREFVRIASDGGRIGSPAEEVDDVAVRVDVAVVGVGNLSGREPEERDERTSTDLAGRNDAPARRSGNVVG